MKKLPTNSISGEIALTLEEMQGSAAQGNQIIFTKEDEKKAVKDAVIAKFVKRESLAVKSPRLPRAFLTNSL